MIESKYRGPELISYKNGDLSELKYIKIIYSDINQETHEFKTEINYLCDDYLSLYVKKTKKKEEKEELQEDKIDDEVAKASYNDYLNKLAEIRQAKEKAEETGNFDDYYKAQDEINQSKRASREIEQNDEDEQEEEQDNKFDIECPQEITLKFVIGDLLYISKGMLVEVNKKATKVYFRIAAPDILNLQQQRKFYRISLRRLCLLVATNKEGNSNAFVARSINLSAGGVLINRLEDMTSNKYIKLNPEDYEIYNMILVLEMDKILKLTARYIRQEENSKSYRYAFEFINIEDEKVDFISKYVIRKQIEELSAEYNAKNKTTIKKHR